MTFQGMFAQGAVMALALILLAGSAVAATLTVDDSGGAGAACFKLRRSRTPPYVSWKE